MEASKEMESCTPESELEGGTPCRACLDTFFPMLVVHTEPLQQARYWLYLCNNFESSVLWRL